MLSIKDRNSHILGVVNIDGININLEMIKQGLAEVYGGDPPKDFDVAPYRNAEAEAKATEQGMWSLKDKHISPYEWRKIH